jgi:hypothetical protein
MWMRKLLPSLVAIGLLLAASLAAAADPKTALGKWMVQNMGTAFSGPDGETPDYATLQASITLLISKEPPAATYPKWDGFLQQGLAAVKANDKAGLKKTCKGCHDAHKAAYIADTTVPKAFP